MYISPNIPVFKPNILSIWKAKYSCAKVKYPLKKSKIVDIFPNIPVLARMTSHCLPVITTSHILLAAWPIDIWGSRKIYNTKYFLQSFIWYIWYIDKSNKLTKLGRCDSCWIANSWIAKITNTARRVSQNCLKSKADWSDKADRADMANIKVPVY